MTSPRPAPSILLVLAGCATTDPQPIGSAALSIRVQIVAVTNHPAPARGAAVEVALTNDGAASVWLARCGPALATEVEAARNDQWVNASYAACPAINDMSRVDLIPGGTVRSFRSIPDTGRYRLRFGTSVAPGSTEQWSLTSPEFQVR